MSGAFLQSVHVDLLKVMYEAFFLSPTCQAYQDRAEYFVLKLLTQ